MDWRTILNHFQTTTSEEQGQAFAQLRGQLQRIIGCLEAYERSEDKSVDQPARRAIIEQLDTATWAQLLQIQAGLPVWSRTAFREFRLNTLQQIEELRKLVGQEAVPSLQTSRDRLSACVSQLEAWEERAEKSRRHYSYLMGFGSLVVFLGGPLFLFFQFWHGDIKLESVSLLFPTDPYVDTPYFTPADLSYNRPLEFPNREAFLHEYSKFYFGHPSSFAERNLEQQAGKQDAEKNGEEDEYDRDLSGNRLHRWRIVLQNTSARSAEYVSEVRETVEFVTEKEFPWDLLDVVPDLITGQTGEFLTISNHGYGPALNLQWKVLTSSGDYLSSEAHSILLGKQVGKLPMADTSSLWQTISLVPDPTGELDSSQRRLARPMYLTKQTTADEGAIKDSDEPTQRSATAGKPITTFGELTAATKAIAGGNIRLSLSFENIKGDREEIAEEIALAPDVVLYLKSGVEQEPQHKNGAAQKDGMRMYLALANAFSPPLVPMDAKDRLTASVELQMEHLEEGERTSRAAQFDAFLAPQGRISIFTTARGMKTGVYAVSVEVDGQERARFLVETLAPPLDTFPEYAEAQWVEIFKFRKRIGRSDTILMPSYRYGLEVGPLDQEAIEIPALPLYDGPAGA